MMGQYLCRREKTEVKKKKMSLFVDMRNLKPKRRPTKY